ncbi:hypothetical protein LAZ40_11910 [Cereibacter sphaeroides]|uniref:hypothetical protein n=1 Tax=Cereibacter sphaeroides TaxID=1063 RepID=UPI001F2C31A0|nr:hypothetical protein [Cereibacter sphaeroides]MCE6959725.1 hypothetical protein [Cereibacter sphaeroides]MCE6974414.1 hypothetical protein [Cereibacter sphaeroides]
MNRTGMIAGVECVFGARWDDAKGKARLKTKYRDTIGYYDDKDVPPKAVPALAAIHESIAIGDALAAYALFYHDDEGTIFGSVVFSAGQVAPLSETIYETAEEWENAIIRSTRDPNIDHIYFPEGAVSFEDDKHRRYEFPTAIEVKSLPRLAAASNLGLVLAGVAMSAVLAAIPLGAWIYIAEPFAEETADIEMVVEKIRPNFTEVLGKCAADLEEPWPAPPEWTLRQEGCVAAPDMAKVTFPIPADQRPYAYRFYELEPQNWDEFLSHAAFIKMVERFPGQFVEGPNQIVLFTPYDLSSDTVDDAYMPDTDPAAILRANFVGAMELNANDGVGGTTGSTDLELDKVLKRLEGKRLTPAHVYRQLEIDRTGLEVSPERIDTRQVRVE